MTENVNTDLEKIMSLSKEELNRIFSQMSAIEIEKILEKLNGVNQND